MTASSYLGRGPLRDAAFDIAEKLFLILLAGNAIMRLAPSLSTQPWNLLVLVSECMAVTFVLIRRPAARADWSPYAAAIALIGTASPLLVAPGGEPLVPPAVGSALMIAGLAFSIAAKISLNLSFGLAAANRGVKRSGPYRILRHPMYAGYVVMQVGFLLMNPSPWNLLVYGVAWTVQVLRTHAEEQVLLEDAAYQAYAAEVRFRLIPGVF